MMLFNNQRVSPSVTAEGGTVGTIAQPLYNGTKRTIMIVGASVAWGDGLDQTQSYAALMQAKIDATVGVSLGGWTARNVHIDDWQSANNGTAYVYPTVPGTPPTNIPMNGESNVPGYGTGNGSQVSGYSSGVGPFMNPTVPSAYTTQGSSKLNVDTVGGTAPSYIPANIFGYYTGTVSSGPTTTGDGVILFTTANQNIRGAMNWSAGNTNYMLVGLIGTGSMYCYLADSAGTTFATIPIAGTTRSGIAMEYFGPYNAAHSGVGSFSFYSASGSLQIATICPTKAAQASNHLLVQVCARNSYCLQDYINTNGTDIYDVNYIFLVSTASAAIGDTYTNGGVTYTVTRTLSSGTVLYTNSSSTSQPPASGTLTRVSGAGTASITYSLWTGGTGQTIPTLIKQSCINQPVNGAGLPVYIIYDSYNSMVTPSRILPPGDATTAGTYAYTLLNLAKELGSSALYGAGFSGDANAGRVILTMPFVPNPSSGFTFPVGHGPVDYRNAIATLAKNSFGSLGASFIDQSGLPSVANSAFLFNDGLHPSNGNRIGAQAIANLYIEALGL